MLEAIPDCSLRTSVIGIFQVKLTRRSFERTYELEKCPLIVTDEILRSRTVKSNKAAEQLVIILWNCVFLKFRKTKFGTVVFFYNMILNVGVIVTERVNQFKF